MRATAAAAAIAVLCFAAQVAPSCAAPSFRERATANPAPASLSNLGKTAGGSLISTAFGILASSAIGDLFSEFSNRSVSSRDMLEVLEARVNQEQTARKYRRELIAALLDLRSLDEMD